VKEKENDIVSGKGAVSRRTTTSSRRGRDRPPIVADRFRIKGPTMQRELELKLELIEQV
jgi:hypothetical protein